MKKRHVFVVLGVLFVAAMVQMGARAIPARAGDEDKGAGGFLVDALIGAGEGAVVSQASGGKAGKGALIGAGTGLAREAIVKPMLKGGLQQGGGQTEPVTRSRTVVAEPIDPYTKGYQEGFKEGFDQGYKAGLNASQR